MTAPRVQVEIAATNMAGQTLESVKQQVKQLGEDVKLSAAAFRLGTISADDYKQAMKTAAEQARAVAQSAGAGNAQLVPLAGILNQTATSAGVANGGLNTIKAGLTSLTTQALGSTGAVGTVAQSLLTLGAGTPVALGVVSGIAAITLAYQAFTKQAREAAERTDEFIKKQVEAAKLRANPNAPLTEGAAETEKRLQDLKRELTAAEQLTKFGGSSALIGATQNLRTVAAIKKEILQAQQTLDETALAIAQKADAQTQKSIEASKQAAEQMKTEYEARKRLTDQIVKQAAARAALLLKETTITNTDIRLSGVVTTTPQALLPTPDGRAPGSAQTPASLLALQVQRLKEQAAQAAADLGQSLKTSFANSVAGALVDGIANGFAALFQSGKLGDGFKALTNTLLSGIGQAMVAFGKQSLLASTLMVKIKAALASFNPIVGVAASIALIAAGSLISGLAGAANSAFGGASSAAAGASGVGSSFGASASAVANGSNGTVTVVWPKDAFANPSDPTFQDFFAETIKQLGATRQLVIVTA